MSDRLKNEKPREDPFSSRGFFYARRPNRLQVVKVSCDLRLLRDSLSSSEPAAAAGKERAILV